MTSPLSLSTQFYLTQEITACESKHPANNQLQCQQCFIIAWHTPPNTSLTKRVENLLNAKLVNNTLAPPLFIITPRQGTISAWSSKAQSLFTTCQIEGCYRIERLWSYTNSDSSTLNSTQINNLAESYFDKMTQQVLFEWQQCQQLFNQSQPKPLEILDISTKQKIQSINQSMGLALSPVEIDYLTSLYNKLARNPTDAELMMFAQVNSEHCRHKIFNAKWIIDNQPMPHSLFAMIRNTYKNAPQDISIAYDDNAAVLTGDKSMAWQNDKDSHQYHLNSLNSSVQIKVETHNHPTAISPYPGAATGSGGELRDEAATGRGGIPKAGLVGYSVSQLHIPQRPLDFENPTLGKPQHIRSSLEIMLQAPLGAARYNNEFGRPCIVGYFRSFLREVNQQYYGYHKPIMLAGGLGSITQENIDKKPIKNGSLLIVLGAAAQLIGLGGGAISSKKNTQHNEALDFSSVQRDNAEIQRRCQEVITRCSYLGAKNPIVSIHDVGAGGISNALPELVNDSQQGAIIDLRKVLSDEPSMSPMEIWCNESQERYVLAIEPHNLALFEKICERERCPMAVVGTSTDKDCLQVTDSLLEKDAVNLPLSDLLGKMPKMLKKEEKISTQKTHKNKNQKRNDNTLEKIAIEVLRHPTVGDKSFLITIGDRSVGGLVHRDQMIGHKQIPVADCGITLRDYINYSGEAMSIGERTPIAIENSAAAARMAVAEAITNMLATPLDSLSQIKLSCNWMAAAQQKGMGKDLYDAVHTVGLEFCPELDIAIPVGKDSMSMQTEWTAQQNTHKVTSPLSLIVSAFALLPDTRNNATPLLNANATIKTDLWLIDLGLNKNRLKHTILDEIIDISSNNIFNDYDEVADITAHTLKNGFKLIQQLRKNDLLLAYHDRSDGGLWTTLCEMLFTSECSLTLEKQCTTDELIAFLFNEEIAMVVETPQSHRKNIQTLFSSSPIAEHCHHLGSPTQTTNKTLSINTPQSNHTFDLNKLQCHWNETSYHIKKLRDNPECVEQERKQLQNQNNPNKPNATLTPYLSNKLSKLLASPTYQASLNREIQTPNILSTLPKIAILREQGINGHQEMAFAFYQAGFQPIDVHMSDILNGSNILQECVGLAACGGFSYGDVLGAGGGWAKSILFNPFAHDQFQQFFHRSNTFSLGVCNGCQMLSHLKKIIPGAEQWNTFTHNQSAQFEARLIQLKITKSPSILLADMEECILPTVVSHGEGRINHTQPNQTLPPKEIQCAHYVDSHHQITTQYPANPNGSTDGITALTSTDGRATIMMPHPERTFRLSQYSWHPKEWGKFNDISPWMKLFTNAKGFVK